MLFIHAYPQCRNFSQPALGERRGMFLSRNGLKKLMNNAYKGGGLTVKNDGHGYSISGAYWAVYFLKGEIPKETLGDLITLVGELPENRERYVATKEGNQIEIYDEADLSALDAAEHCRDELIRVPVMINYHPYVLGLLQNPEDLQITPIDCRLLDIVQPALIDADDGEELPIGPLAGSGLVEGKFFNGASWTNNRMAYSVGFIEPSDDFTKGVIRSLEKSKLWEGDHEQA